MNIPKQFNDRAATMVSHLFPTWPLVLLLAALVLPARAVVTFETEQVRLEIGEDAIVRRLVAKPDNIEYAVAAPRCPFATVYRGGCSVPSAVGYQAAVIGRWVYQGGAQFDATRIRRQGDKLLVEFGAANVMATYRVRIAGEYVAFELLSVEGEPIDRIEFVRLNVRRLPMLGQWVNLAYDERFGVCLCGGNLQTDIGMIPKESHVEMTAAAEAVVGFRGATAVLFGCRDPQTKFLDAMANVERDFQLPAGAIFRRSPIQRFSYLWAARPDPQNIGDYIRWAKTGGFRMVLLSYGAFSGGAGHYVWNKRYPNGMADLKRVTDAIRAAGLKVGLHIHYCKASKRDPYVTPVPDDRFHVVRTFTLARDVTADASVLPVSENPDGCTVDNGRRILKLDKELVEYEDYSRQPPFQFTGCRRGHLATRATAHAAGAKCALLDVDTWPSFIRFDQNTDIQDEVARRLADIYKQTGPYDMIYFDGAEDVHEPFWYHTASAQYRVFRLLDSPPPVCESPHYTHFSWHMISRGNAYDNVATPDGMKDFCRLMPCPTAAARVMDFSRIDFGWLGQFGGKKTGCAGPDVYEYVASRAAAWDCPISLHVSLEDFQSNPRTEDCLAAIKIWEDARLGNHLSEADRRALRNVSPQDAHYVSCYQQRIIYQNSRDPKNLTDVQRRILADRREHHLFVNEQGRYDLVEIEELTGVGQDKIKAFLFQRAGRPEDTYALVWAVEGELRLRLPNASLSAMRPFGSQWPVNHDRNTASVVVGPRTCLLMSRTPPDQAVQLLRRAEIAR